MCTLLDSRASRCKKIHSNFLSSVLCVFSCEHGEPSCAQAAVAKVQEFLQDLAAQEEVRKKESAEMLEEEKAKAEARVADMQNSIDQLKQQVNQLEQEKKQV